ncbi:hypothetical protein [Pedobacter sp.]|uniref:hypothetical protein n=1 Tax=Pedobacter sp. TaxID=1411316 RepID=UPI002B93CD40|nr:hypothetical protein [Pedobacter sp.]HWW38908.1 hypothetical protein [Pedobacter sp.]
MNTKPGNWFANYFGNLINKNKPKFDDIDIAEFLEQKEKAVVLQELIQRRPGVINNVVSSKYWDYLVTSISYVNENWVELLVRTYEKVHGYKFQKANIARAFLYITTEKIELIFLDVKLDHRRKGVGHTLIDLVLSISKIACKKEIVGVLKEFKKADIETINSFMRKYDTDKYRFEYNWEDETDSFYFKIILLKDSTV